MKAYKKGSRQRADCHLRQRGIGIVWHYSPAGDHTVSNERTIFDPEMSERRNKRSEIDHAFDPRTTIKMIYHI